MCVAVGRIPGGALPSPAKSEAKPAEALPESSAADDGEADLDEDDADELDLAAMPFKELKELAKSYGINPTGMKRAAVEEAVSEAMGGPPALAAEDPE